MKTNTKLIISSILLATSLNAIDNQTQINFEQDNDGNINPNIFVPIYWDNEYYSGVGYTSSTSKDIGKLNSFTDSKNGMVSSEKITVINWITKNISNYSIGLVTSISNIKNNEFGYIHDTENLFGNGDDYWVAFDNDIELDIVKTGIFAKYTTSFDKIYLRTIATVFPSSNLDVKQSTIFKPLANDIGVSSSSTSQDLGYSLQLEALYDTNSFISFGFMYSYDFEPIKYDIAQLNKSDSTYNFKTNTIDTDETTTKYLFKFKFDKKMLGGLYPSLGFGKIKTSIKDNKTNQTKTEDKNIVSFGFEKIF